MPAPPTPMPPGPAPSLPPNELRKDGGELSLRKIDKLERRWWQSKKFAIWAISFLSFGGLLGWGFQASTDRWVLIALIGAMALTSGIGLLGQAFVDAAVRFARAWRGIGEVWTEAK